jgi:hypothetical protein
MFVNMHYCRPCGRLALEFPEGQPYLNDLSI